MSPTTATAPSSAETPAPPAPEGVTAPAAMSGTDPASADTGVRGLWVPALAEPAPRDLCTDCGVSRMVDHKACGSACQFIRPDYTTMELRAHGQARDPKVPDQLYFGPHRRMVRARLKAPREGAQWTGITTRIAERLLEEGAVDAVLAVKPHPDDVWKPQPVIVTEPEAMAECRGMRMGYAPLLALLEPAAAKGYKRLAVVGIPCQVYALRALEERLGLERLYVIGTPCSDNTTTENFHTFLGLLSDKPETITYLEFRADYHVELRFTDGRRREIPFLKLPISQLPGDFFPLTCRTCVDYTNALADITVGYMGGEGEQWLLIRNERGEDLVKLLGDEVALSTPGDKGNRAAAVKGFITNTERAVGGLPVRAMPDWVRPIVAWLQPRIGPRGLEFARARLEMKAAETVLHLRRYRPARMKNMIPDHVWRLVEPYGLTRRDDE
nr:Coenzyme F420 hydrogenase/dehydrogenase, beta subunit C-terminal domain [Rhodothalassium salexigens]